MRKISCQSSMGSFGDRENSESEEVNMYSLLQLKSDEVLTCGHQRNAKKPFERQIMCLTTSVLFGIDLGNKQHLRKGHRGKSMRESSRVHDNIHDSNIHLIY